MIYPKKLTSEDLQHPADKKSSFNGDKRRPQKEQGFMASRASQGLKTVEGTTTPTNKVQPSRSFQRPPSSIRYERPYSHLTDRQKVLYNRELRDNAPEVISLTDRQRKMTYGRGK